MAAGSPAGGLEGPQGARAGPAAETALARLLAQRALPQKPVSFGTNCKLDADNDYRFSSCFQPEAPFPFRGRTYPTAEHAFQAHRYPPGVRDRFAVGGDLAEWGGLGFFFDGQEAEKKREHWGRKRMLGAVAKLSASSGKKADLPPPRAADGSLRECRLYLGALAAKFSGNPGLAEALDRTRGRYLLEVARGAEKRESPGKEPEVWGGAAVLGADGLWHLHGENRAGLCLMAYRESRDLFALSGAADAPPEGA